MAWRDPTKKKAYNAAYNAAHREELRARKLAYNTTHREALRDAKRLRLYGVTREWFDEMLDAQEGRCAICEKPIGRSAGVDHDHVTGTARALLCRACNARLHALENADWFASAKSYLEVHAAR